MKKLAAELADKIGAVYEKILRLKIDVKILSWKMDEVLAVSETILGWKIGVKNSKMENWCIKPRSGKKILGQKIGTNNFFVRETKNCINRWKILSLKKIINRKIGLKILSASAHLALLQYCNTIAFLHEDKRGFVREWGDVKMHAHSKIKFAALLEAGNLLNQVERKY